MKDSSLPFFSMCTHAAGRELLLVLFTCTIFKTLMSNFLYHHLTALKTFCNYQGHLAMRSAISDAKRMVGSFEVRKWLSLAVPFH